MALTMTRTRTQTTLTKLVTLLANVNGELEFVRELLMTEQGPQEELESRKVLLLRRREALVATIHQFDPKLDLGAVEIADGWRKTRRPSAGQ